MPARQRHSSDFDTATLSLATTPHFVAFSGRRAVPRRRARHRLAAACRPRRLHRRLFRHLAHAIPEGDRELSIILSGKNQTLESRRFGGNPRLRWSLGRFTNFLVIRRPDPRRAHRDLARVLRWSDQLEIRSQEIRSQESSSPARTHQRRSPISRTRQLPW